MAIRLSVPRDTGQNRLWGIPFVGAWVRAILCIPQAILLAILGFVMYLVAFISWIPILVNGRQATWIVDLFRLIARLQSRVSLYVSLVHGQYPWFNDLPGHPIQVTVDDGEPQNRLWGIPIVGFLVRAIVLIPHFLVLWLLGIGAAFVVLVSWIPVLVNGRQADPIVDFLGGVYRYGLRTVAYLILITGQYPPFRMSD